MKTTAYILISLALLIVSFFNLGAGLFAQLSVAKALSTSAAFPATPRKPAISVVRTHYGGGGGYFGGK